MAHEKQLQEEEGMLFKSPLKGLPFPDQFYTITKSK